MMSVKDYKPCTDSDIFKTDILEIYMTQKWLFILRLYLSFIQNVIGDIHYSHSPFSD